MLWIDYFRELDTTERTEKKISELLWIDYFRELDTTLRMILNYAIPLWIDYFRELDTTLQKNPLTLKCCGLITLGN